MWFFTLFNASIIIIIIIIIFFFLSVKPADTNMCHENFVDCRLGKNFFPLS